jgi:two-component system chemotaxis response regulator CheB
LAFDKNIIVRWHNAEILLLGGSAGSFKLIFEIVRNFSENLNKTVIIVIHRKKNFLSEIEKLFTENIHILFSEITDKDQIKKNTVYIAPANYHTLVEKNGCFSLDVSEPIWYSKPSIDVTFESAADAFGDKCIAILLSGANEDGAEGLLALRKAGALTIVQNPADAEMSTMPQAAINIDAADYMLDASDILTLFNE